MFLIFQRIGWADPFQCYFLAYLIKSRCMVQLGKNWCDNYLGVNCEENYLCLKFTKINKIQALILFLSCTCVLGSAKLYRKKSNKKKLHNSLN